MHSALKRPAFLVAFAAVLLATTVLPRGAAAQDADPASDEAQPTSQVDAVSFQQALAPYGEWADNQQYGRVWIPTAARDPAWQPYTAGQWVYTDEYGWYFVGEEPFAWIVYHYGRWIADQTDGWIWIPDDVWGPAWVAWRQGDGFLGWAPLPPDTGYDIDTVPDTWIFVETAAFVRPDIRSYCFPRHEARERFYSSRFEDRARRREGSPIGHDAGIQPAIVGGATGHPLRPYEVRPQLFPGTAGFIGGRRVFGRNDADPSRPHREIALERQVEPTAPIHENETLPQLERQPQAAPGINRAEPAAGPPAIRTGPMTTPVVPPPNERPQAAPAPVIRQEMPLQRQQLPVQRIEPRQFAPAAPPTARPLLQTAPRVVPNVQQRSAAPLQERQVR
jgi:Family of unknown function (DUF6600)